MNTPECDAPLRILLVEDHLESATALSTLLGVLGHQVTVANRSDDALAQAAQAHAAGTVFDVVLSDLNLPDGTGWDLMRELRWRFGLRGVALSAYRRAADRRRSEEAGFLDHLVKPVTLDALVQILGGLAPAEQVELPRVS